MIDMFDDGNLLQVTKDNHIEGFVQGDYISIANALELWQTCTEPSI